MKKYVKKIFTIILLLIVFTTNNTVEAVGNQSGGSSSGKPGAGQSTGADGGWQPVIKTMGYRVSLIKYVTNSNEQPKTIKSKTFIASDFNEWFYDYKRPQNVYYTDSKPKTAYKNSSDVKWIKTNKLPLFEKGVIQDKNWNDIVFTNPSTYDWDQVYSYFQRLSQKNNTDKLEEYLQKTFNFSVKVDPSKCADMKFYYLLVEPMLMINDNDITYGDIFYGTAMELSTIKNGGIGTSICEDGSLLNTCLYTETTKFSYKKVDGTTKSVNFDWYSGVGSDPKKTGVITGKDGYGVGTLWIGHLYDRCEKCYERTVVKKTGELACKNTNQNNEAQYEEQYTETPCVETTPEENKTNTADGKKVAETTNCILYCKESAMASFPGNVQETIELKDYSSEFAYVTWPGIRSLGAANLLKMSSRYTCKFVAKEGKSCTNDKATLKGKTTNVVNSLVMGVSLEAGTYNKINTKLTPYDIKTITIEDKEDIFIVEKESYFKIPYGLNQLYNKETGEVKNCTDQQNCKATDKIVNRGEGVISFKSTDENQNQTMILKNVTLGSGNQFGKIINGTEYKCNYNFIPNCTCPPGTKQAGKDLMGYVKNGMTCSEAQAQECDDNDDETPTTCTGYSDDTWNAYKTCYLEELKKCNTGTGTTSEFRKLIFDFDIAGVMTIDKAIQHEEVKKSNEDSYCAYEKCKSHLAVKNQVKLDLTSCISDKMKNGLTKEQASDVCTGEKCNLCTASSGTVYDLRACMAIGNSYATCKYLYCPGAWCPPPNCPPPGICKKECNWYDISQDKKVERIYIKKCTDTNQECDRVKLTCPGGDEFMNDPTTCISSYLSYKLGKSSIADGLSKGVISAYDVRSAFAACESTVCPSTESKIIFRQIDLNNPFPGKKNENTYTEFSNSGKGRKPGENWNSVTYVKNKILNARGERGYNLYTSTTIKPLYVITLTPSDIKEIRGYNEETKYSDFTLECTSGDKKSKCISRFLHDNDKFNKIVTGGKCKNINAIGFDECYRDDR